MKNIVAYAILALASCLFPFQAQASALPQEVQSALPSAALSGQATLRFWGFEVYRASLWVAPGFAEAAYAQSPFVLELTYLRDFKGTDIAKRSMTEMLRQAVLEPAVQARWEERMRAVFPDVQAGDRITGLHQPGRGAVFWRNGQPIGEIRDSAFAALFFGIWLSPQTSEPALRQALLAQSRTAAAAP